MGKSRGKIGRRPRREELHKLNKMYWQPWATHPIGAHREQGRRRGRPPHRPAPKAEAQVEVQPRHLQEAAGKLGKHAFCAMFHGATGDLRVGREAKPCKGNELGKRCKPEATLANHRCNVLGPPRFCIEPGGRWSGAARWSWRHCGRRHTMRKGATPPGRSPCGPAKWANPTGLLH